MTIIDIPSVELCSESEWMYCSDVLIRNDWCHGLPCYSSSHLPPAVSHSLSLTHTLSHTLSLSPSSTSVPPPPETVCAVRTESPTYKNIHPQKSVPAQVLEDH